MIRLPAPQLGILVSAAFVVVAGCGHGSQGLLPQAAMAPAQERAGRTSSTVWSVVTSPNAPPGSDGVYDDQLYAVAGTSSADVWAVGDDCCYPHGSQEYFHALFEHWNGRAWKIVPYPRDEPADSYLNAVAAISPTDAWAVGDSVFPKATLAEHWNGKKWSVVATPYIANGGVLEAIHAISHDDVWAAGEGNYAAVLEHWDGTAWSFVPGLTMGGLTFLNAITASGPNDISAIGESFDPSALVFAEHWNGSKWSSVAPYTSFFASAFNGIAQISHGDAWGVGYEEPSQQQQVPQTMIARWNGSSWSIVPSPNKEPTSRYLLNNTLYGVAAQSSNDVWAVGYWTYYPGSGTTRSLFLRWNGTSWKVASGPPALESSNNAAFNGLQAIARVGPHDFWAVGSQAVPGKGTETLTAHTTHG
jgi:hypothetical protein